MACAGRGGLFWWTKWERERTLAGSGVRTKPQKDEFGGRGVRASVRTCVNDKKKTDLYFFNMILTAYTAVCSPGRHLLSSEAWVLACFYVCNALVGRVAVFVLMTIFDGGGGWGSMSMGKKRR
jgi:hypothetical protein